MIQPIMEFSVDNIVETLLRMRTCLETGKLEKLERQ